MTNGIYRTFFLIILAGSAFFCLGWANDWDGIRAASRQVTTIQAAFIQEKQMKILSHPLISKGTFYFQKPESLRWEYETPIRSIFLMHDGKTIRYIQSKEGLIKERGANLQALQIVLQEITQWMGGKFDDNPTFTARLEPERLIVLTPKQKAMSALIRKIELRLSDRPGLMDSVTIFESEDSFTKLTFQNARVNQKIAQSVFKEK